jgi:parallel beta-helix repeat protein
MSGNMIEECEGTAIILDRDCYGITLSANVLADNFGGGIDLRDAHGCAVSANTFTIDWVRGLIVGPASGRITVTGNNFSDSYLGEQTRRQATQNLATGVLLDGTRDVVVSGNQFSGLDGPAVEARGDCRRLAVTGNICVGVSRSTSGNQPALDVAGARDSVVQNNITTPGDEPVVPNAAAEEKE